MLGLVKTVLEILRFSWRVAPKRLAIGLSLLLLGSACAPAAAASIRLAIDASPAGAPFHIPPALPAAVLLLVGQVALSHFSHLWYFELGELAEVDFSKRVSRLVGNLAAVQVSAKKTRDDVSLLQQDARRMRGSVSSVLQLIGTFVQIVLTSVLLASVSPWLLALPAAAAIPVMMSRRAEKVLQTLREVTAPDYGQLDHYRELVVRPETQKELRVFGAAENLHTRHRQEEGRILAEVSRSTRSYLGIRIGGQSIYVVAIIMTVLLLAHLAGLQLVSIGDLGMSVVLLLQIGTQVANLITTSAEVSSIEYAFARLDTLTEHDPSSDRDFDGESRGVPETIKKGITFDNVSFIYPDAQGPTLTELNFTIPAGSVCAVVGENGAGKSTLINLILGAYTPSSGHISIDGVDLASLDQDGWVKRTSALFQGFLRFQGPARISIGIGNLAQIGDGPAIARAIAAAECGDLIEKIGGLASTLGSDYEDGRNLSGGQWQSIGFARTMMRTDSHVLALDEPASALDPERELALYEAYARAAECTKNASGGITLMVTHRLSSVSRANFVLVLEHGKLTQFGPPEVLILDKKGLFAQLYDKQAAVFEDDA